MHDLPLITTISVAFSLAWLLGIVTQKMGLSPIVGYLLAGILIGPYTPGFVGDLHLAHQLAEIGVILLMFGVGLHFHLKDLLAVKSVAIPGAMVQSVVATLVAMGAFTFFEMSPTSGAVIGMAIAVASTVVLMRVLMDADVLNSTPGHVAVGWLLVEDMFTVVVLVLLPVMGSSQGDAEQAVPIWQALGWAFLKLFALVAILWLVGSRVIPWVLVQVARLRSRELFTLTVLVFSIAMAAASYAFFGASMALGAFLAGMLVALSPASHQAAADALPLRDSFAVLFFVSVGMLFDPAFLVRQPGLVLVAMGIILLVKPLTAMLIVGALGYSVRTSLTVAIGLAQIGEFSFILSDVARKHELVPEDGHNLLVAAAILSITINPILFRWLTPIENWLRGRPRLWKLLNHRAERKAMAINQATSERMSESADGSSPGASDDARSRAIVIGFGPVGRSVHQLLKEAGVPTVVIDLNMETISALHVQQQDAIFGDASQEAILEQAGMHRASHVILTIPNPAARLAVITAARNLNSKARILVRAHYLSEREDLEEAGATAAVFEENEAAIALARLVLTTTGAHRSLVDAKIRDLRLQLIRDNMSNIRHLRVQTAMVPWSRVQRLSNSSTRQEIMTHVARHRHSRWPVVDSSTGAVQGYLLAKDLLSEAATNDDWTHLVRPLHRVRPTDDIESTLSTMQDQGINLCLVDTTGSPLGIITLEDLLEQVFGRIDDEDSPPPPTLSLHDAVAAGGVVMDLQSETLEEAIRELADSIPNDQLPPDVHVAQWVLDRERIVSTDLGVGVAVPHARCPWLAAPILVVGRSLKGLHSRRETTQPIRLVFLILTPSDQPDVQLSMLSQLARLVQNETTQQRLLEASSVTELLEHLAMNAEWSSADGRL